MPEDSLRAREQSNRPSEKPFYQQRLAAWTPILTIKSVYPYFLLIGILFIPLGAVFIVTSNNINEKSIQYTLCKDAQGNLCSELVRKPEYFLKYKACECEVPFTLETQMRDNVLFYYGLTNFYQNHRIYVRSRDDYQLNGQTVETLDANCEPYRYAEIDGKKVPFAPCGAIASSLFNDTFTLRQITSLTTRPEVPWTSKNIAWPSDVNKKFGKFVDTDNQTKPIGWKQTAVERNPDSYSGDEELLVWMRTSALPSFRKLHRRLVRKDDFFAGLPAGNYVLSVKYAYPVTQFSGSKQFIITESSWLGGKNLTLGVSYVVVGIIHLILGFVLLAFQCKIQK